ncbi:MAG TPA: Ig-like domain-containing protein, partial [Solirubrobacterales bacterium]
MLGISIKRQLARTVLCGAVAAMCLTAPAAAPAALSPGPEIQVNANTGFHQEPVIAPGPNGGFTVVWRGTDSAYDPDCISLNQSCPGSQEIYARRFDAAGAPLGGEITVNATTTGNQSAPAVASDPGGGFTVVWAGNGPGDGTGIYARRFDAAGAPLGGEMAVNATTVGDQAMPAVASDPGGGFTAVWQSHSEVGGQDYYDVYARRFDAAGAALGGEIAVNTVANGAVFEAYGGASPAIAADAGGGFTVAWHSHTPDSSGWDVYARRFDAGGAPLGGEIAVGTTPGGLLSQPSPAIAPRPGGGFTVTWIEIEFSSSGGCWGWFDYGCTPEITWTFSSAVYARGFDAGGAALGNEFQVTAAAGFSQPAIAPDPGGGYTVVWDSVYVQRFDASGTPLLFDGNTLVAAEESPSRPAVAPDGSGGFTVTWQSTGQPGGSGIYARHFSDIDAPDTRIDSGPGLTNDPTPTFTFAASEQGSSFECRVDSDPFAACSGPGGSHTSTTTLTDGPHSFEVRATDGADRIDPWPARRSFTVDTVPPDTSVYDNPFRIGDPIDFLFTSPIPVFYLSSSESGSGYGCRIYAQGETQPPFSGCGYSTCSYFCVGPYYTPGSPLPDGNYTFEARATDPASNMDPTPAIVNFTVDTTPLNAHIDSGPEGPSSDTTATFSFYSSGNDLDHFSCRLSGPGDSLWTDNPCNSPRTYTTLADGDYTFVVRAEDLAGNLGPTASRSFTVDTVADTQIDSGPEGPTNEPTPSFAFSSEAGASFECSLDGSGFSACASPYTTTPLADGSHTFEVRATDALGNTDPSPASRSFTVDTEAPAEPSFNATDPASPANDNTPLIRGSAVEGTVRIYASGDCSGAVAGEGSAAGFAGPGIEVSVADDSTTSFHATVTDAAGNPSACSVDSLSYTEDS